jgi:hygromycin-B 7''-O-kinase
LDDHGNLPNGLALVARRHGVDPAQVEEVPGGVANRGFALGEKLFVRVSRPGFEADLHKETTVIPVARSSGVLTPAIVEYDDSRRLLDTPYVVMERVDGTEPSGVPTGLAEQLARLHQAEQVVIAGITEDGWDDPWRRVDDLAGRGYLDPGTGAWLSDWFTRLAGRFDRDQPKVLIHGDVASHNLLATPAGELSALIDWGDATYAPPAVDFAKLPLEDGATILPDYLDHLHPAVPAEQFAASVLWLHLSWALGKLPAPPWPGQRHWTAPPASRILGLLRFFARSPAEPWAGLG